MISPHVTDEIASLGRCGADGVVSETGSYITYRGLKFTCIRNISHTGVPCLARVRISPAAAPTLHSSSRSPMCRAASGSTLCRRRRRITTNCIQVVAGGTRPMIPRIGVDSDPPSVTP